MIGRIVRSADFERVLGTPSRARSSHFAVHHLMAAPSLPGPAFSTRKAELSTGSTPEAHSPVDELPAAAAVSAPVEGRWLGCVVPKRHARRAVTRSLLKRQIRAVFADAAASLPPGLWVVRLRLPFDRKQFPSASSDALRQLVRSELLQRCGKLQRGNPAARPSPAAQPASGSR